MPIKNVLSQTVDLRRLLSITENTLDNTVTFSLRTNSAPADMEWLLLTTSPGVSSMLGHAYEMTTVALKLSSFNHPSIFGVPLHTTLDSRYHADLQQGVAYMHVLCDMLENSTVNNKYLNLLTQVRLVSDAADFNEGITTAGIGGEERVIRKGVYTKVNIQLLDNLGHRIKFAYGSHPVTLTLRITRQR